MGGKTKGKWRPTSLSEARSLVRGMGKEVLSRASERTVVGFVAVALPQAAPWVWGAYASIELLRTAIKARREYKELIQTMSEDRARTIVAARSALREGQKLATASLDKATENLVYGAVTSLVTRPEVRSLVVSRIGNTMSNKERSTYDYMLIATLTQFALGSIMGARADIVDKVARGLIK